MFSINLGAGDTMFMHAWRFRSNKERQIIDKTSHVCVYVCGVFV